jgi:hypothetical protein
VFEKSYIKRLRAVSLGDVDAINPLKSVRAYCVEVKEDDLRFLSPLLRHHIGIYGRYSFDFRRYDEIPSPENLSY